MFINFALPNLYDDTQVEKVTSIAYTVSLSNILVVCAEREFNRKYNIHTISPKIYMATYVNENAGFITLGDGQVIKCFCLNSVFRNW